MSSAARQCSYWDARNWRAARSRTSSSREMARCRRSNSSHRDASSMYIRGERARPPASRCEKHATAGYCSSPDKCLLLLPLMNPFINTHTMTLATMLDCCWYLRTQSIHVAMLKRLSQVPHSWLHSSRTLTRIQLWTHRRSQGVAVGADESQGENWIFGLNLDG